ncbi:MAG: hypothetical protein ABFD82_15255 [Syntrophaceae bacterium]
MENGEHDVKDMKQIKGKFRLIEGIYITILVLLYALIICTPYIITKDALLQNNILIEEEIVEGFLITVLLVISFFVSVRYRRELDSYRSHIKELSVKNADVESRLSDAFTYIGAVNVQVEAIQSLFSSLNKYPKDKKDFKNSFHFLAEKVLCVVNVDWVIFRIINVDSLRSVREYSETRGKAVLLKHNISNKSIVATEAIDGCSIVSSDQSNLTIKVFCIIPSEALTTTQKNLIKTIVNALEMLFIVFTSQYYRKSYFKQEAFDNAGSI